VDLDQATIKAKVQEAALAGQVVRVNLADVLVDDKKVTQHKREPGPTLVPPSK
jgi:hypothetical protein